MGSASFFGVSVADRNECQRLLYGFDLNCRSGTELVVLKSVISNMNSFLIPYLSEFHCITLDKVPETLGDVSQYGLYVRYAQAMYEIGKKTTIFLQRIHLKKTKRELMLERR